jgi:hypothetical protein
VKNWALTGPDPHGAPARPLDRATDAIVSGSSGADKGERIVGRHNISRVAQPDAKRFTVRGIVGAGDLRVTEFILAYDGRPSYSVSVMEFFDGKVARETQYFADPFEPGPSRARRVERTG